MLALFVALAVFAAACGDDDETSTDDAGAETTDTTESNSDEGEASDEGGDGEEAETGPGTPAPEPLEETEKVVLVYSAPIEAWANVLLADELGEWEKENLDVEIQTLPGPDGTLLLGQGKADVQLVGISAGVFNAVAAGQPLKYVASTFVEDAPLAGFWVHNDYVTDGEPDPEKLKGSQVMPGIGGGGFGNPGALPLWNLMQELGLEADDVQTVTVNSAPDAAQLLVNGSASISMGLTPHWATIEDSGCCTFLVPTTVSGSFLANTNFLEDRPEVAEAFFRALVRVNRTYLQGDYHSDADVVEAIAAQTGVPAADIAAQPSLVFSPDLEIVTRDVLPQFQDQFRTFELLAYDDDLSPDDMIDTSPVDAVVGGG